MMNPSKNEDDAKVTNVRPEPLCLFCFPDNVPLVGGKTYVNTLREGPVQRKTRAEESFRRFTQDVRQKEKEEFWLRKRTEARIRRRKMKEPIRNLRSYLLTSVSVSELGQQQVRGRPLTGRPQPNLAITPTETFAAEGDGKVLETVKDAWPSPSTRSKFLLRNENQSLSQCLSNTRNQPKMKDKEISMQSLIFNRRLSVPEELMRKCSVSTEKTSEESETNKTTIEISPSSSSTLETARRRGSEEQKPMMERSNAVTLPPKPETTTTNACQQAHSLEKEKLRKTDLPQRVTQNDYYKQGKQILKVRAVDTCMCTCQREPHSSTTVSAKEETDDSGTTESILSSSPTQLPKRESSSGNLSSESDNIRCTCAELSSMETSADLYLSGKSTLSQTVSDKSMSTQDSTVSVNSVSSRGSTVSDNSNSTTPEVERTSAKETTTSPDDSPRTPRNRKNRRRDKYQGCYQPHTKCPSHNDAKHSRNHLPHSNGQRCPVHSENPTQEPQTTESAATNTDRQEDPMPQTTGTTREVAERSQNDIAAHNHQTRADVPAIVEERYKWAKLSQEELLMMQQLRHRRFIESQRKLSNTLPPTPDADSMTVCGTGSAYQKTECMEQAIMIPRYSALPRSLSMLVNTSSPDTSHNSDSDNQSLADSLEDQPVTHVHKLYFDTKKESKPVRGDATTVQENKQKHRQPRGRAFFVSIKDPCGEDEMLENIEKIPQPPERIKNQIFKRHLSLCAKHKHFHPTEEQNPKKHATHKNKKSKSNNNENEKMHRSRKTNQEESKKVRRTFFGPEKLKRPEDETSKMDPTETGTRRKEDKRFGSKIPVLVSSRSTSTSPERDPETKEKITRPKARVRREKDMNDMTKSHTDMETTQILEITHKGTELSLQKPQAVIHPSQVPLDPKVDPPLIIPPLVSTLRIPPFRQTWNKPLAPVRRSPIGKFRQRFEVIPEEKSSSLSSAEERNGRESVPKFADASTSPVPSEKIHFQSYNVNDVPNLIVAKITNKELETLPYVNNSDNQKIILFSSKPQNSNSSKGRDALIAMNREDFNRLAKGWMNFYKLNDNLDNSEAESKSKDNAEEKPKPNAGSNTTPSSEKPRTEGADALSSKEKKSVHQKELNSGSEVKNQKPPELDENIRFDCSNTILRTVKPVPPTDSGRSLKNPSSLPELKFPGQRNCEVHRTGCSEEGKLWLSGEKHVEEDGDTDSDSTDYMEPPSPRVPPLPIDDIPSDATLSSSDSELDAPKPQITTQSLKYSLLKRLSTTNKGRPQKDNSETSRCGKKISENSGWSVTVAGTVELSRSAPDLEMRLSFPASGGPPVVSQSDSGFAEESNSKLSEPLQELDLYTLKKELSSGQRNRKQKWMVTVQNPKSEDAEKLRKQFPRKSGHRLPEVEPNQSKNPKKVLKDAEIDEKMKRLVERKMRAIWPKVQKVIKKEFLTESGRLVTELTDGLDEGSCLSVRGSAVSLERKQKPPTMTERDVTRRYTSRAEN